MIAVDIYAVRDHGDMRLGDAPLGPLKTYLPWLAAGPWPSRAHPSTFTVTLRPDRGSVRVVEVAVRPGDPVVDVVVEVGREFSVSDLVALGFGSEERS